MTMTTTLLLLLATALPGPDRIELDPATMTIDAAETVSVTATAYDEDGTVLADPPVRWIAMNPEVAQVDQAGQVTGISPGEARIAARAGNVMGFATVIVRALPVAVVEASLPVAALVAGTSAPVAVRAATTASSPSARSSAPPPTPASGSEWESPRRERIWPTGCFRPCPKRMRTGSWRCCRSLARRSGCGPMTASRQR